MRINRFIAAATGLSRRRADELITSGKLTVNGRPAALGQEIAETDVIIYEGQQLALATQPQLIMLNKPVGYVCSRSGQGSKTVYDLLPPELHNLKPIGRLDKDSSGLLLLTNDGELAHKLTHPKFQKEKIYEVELDKPLNQQDWEHIVNHRVAIDGRRPSGFRLEAGIMEQAASGEKKSDSYFLIHTSAWRATLAEGRNRQIRRTFAALGYRVLKLHRTHFGGYVLRGLKPGSYKTV